MPYLYAMLLFTTLFLMLLLLPDHAFAWGAGTHLMLGMNLLTSLSSVPMQTASIISSFADDFLYGCIAADIIVGKKYTYQMLNCHRWNIGRKVLDAAKTDSQKACAYGYLSHLAADTVAHNIYVPFKTIKSFNTITLKHAYWETRFDSQISKDVWDAGHRIARENYQDNDIMLRNVLTETLFSFGTNKKIFNSILLVSRMNQWQQAIKIVDEKSRFQIEDQDREEYIFMSMEAIISVLCDIDGSIFFSADPTGETALKTSEKLSKNLKILYSNGKITLQQADAQSESCKNILKDSLFNKEKLKQMAS